jgi:uncharacterized protein with von Willebrand factor type A (vWA) domain
MVPAVARAPRLSPSSRFSELIDGWLFQLGATAGGPHPGRLPVDLEDVARSIAADAEVAVLHLEHLTKEVLRAAFACPGRTSTRRRYSRSGHGVHDG